MDRSGTRVGSRDRFINGMFRRGSTRSKGAGRIRRRGGARSIFAGRSRPGTRSGGEHGPDALAAGCGYSDTRQDIPAAHRTNKRRMRRLAGMLKRSSECRFVNGRNRRHGSRSIPETGGRIAMRTICQIGHQRALSAADGVRTSLSARASSKLICKNRPNRRAVRGPAAIPGTPA